MVTNPFCGVNPIPGMMPAAWSGTVLQDSPKGQVYAI
jgi:hypothetical protein